MKLPTIPCYPMVLFLFLISSYAESKNFNPVLVNQVGPEPSNSFPSLNIFLAKDPQNAVNLLEKSSLSDVNKFIYAALYTIYKTEGNKAADVRVTLISVEGAQKTFEVYKNELEKKAQKGPAANRIRHLKETIHLINLSDESRQKLFQEWEPYILGKTNTTPIKAEQPETIRVLEIPRKTARRMKQKCSTTPDGESICLKEGY